LVYAQFPPKVISSACTGSDSSAWDEEVGFGYRYRGGGGEVIVVNIDITLFVEQLVGLAVSVVTLVTLATAAVAINNT